MNQHEFFSFMDHFLVCGSCPLEVGSGSSPVHFQCAAVATKATQSTRLNCSSLPVRAGRVQTSFFQNPKAIPSSQILIHDMVLTHPWWQALMWLAVCGKKFCLVAASLLWPYSEVVGHFLPLWVAILDFRDGLPSNYKPRPSLHGFLCHPDQSNMPD